MKGTVRPVLLIGGVVLATTGAARTPIHPWAFASGVSVLGVAIGLGATTRRPSPRLARGSTCNGVRSAMEMVAHIRQRAWMLREELDTVGMVAVRARLESLRKDDMPGMIERAVRMRAVLAPDRFAALASSLAAVGYFFNRAASAAADRHRDELISSLEGALSGLDLVARELGKIADAEAVG